MPDRRAHRGPHPEDAECFASSQWPALREAVCDLSWLQSRGYAEISALKIVGDRFALTERQRMAVRRSACSDRSLAHRQSAQLSEQELRGQSLLIDGYNVLTTVEAALAGGVILGARDGCYRDLASMHGTFRKVQETAPALQLIAAELAELGVAGCTIYLDSPVSNSGRLKAFILELAGQAAWNWQVKVMASPDAVLAAATEPIATADSAILDREVRWFNLARLIVSRHVPDVHIVDLVPTPAHP